MVLFVSVAHLLIYTSLWPVSPVLAILRCPRRPNCGKTARSLAVSSEILDTGLRVSRV